MGMETDNRTGYMDPQTAGRYLGVTERTLQSWRRAGKGPGYIRLHGHQNGRLRYSKEELDRWMASQAVRGSHSADGAAT